MADSRCWSRGSVEGIRCHSEKEPNEQGHRGYVDVPGWFIAGPTTPLSRPWGEGGERLHEWVYGLASWRERHGLIGGRTDANADVLDQAFRNTGTTVMGRRMFNLGERYWEDEPPFHMPVFVVTHEARETLIKKGGITFTFVTGGIERALEQAKAAAAETDVLVVGGANIVQQFLRSGLIDELQIHLVPVLLGQGRRLFEQSNAERIVCGSSSLPGSHPGHTSQISYREVTNGRIPLKIASVLTAE